MSEKRTFFLVHDAARKNAAQCAMSAPDGWVVTVSPPSKSRDQEAKQ